MSEVVPCAVSIVKPEIQFTTGEFSAEKWRAYFEENRNTEIGIRFSDGVMIEEELREPLIHSLQRFQIGETGEGTHLKRYAKTVGDTTYEDCIDLFIKEEQGHARILAEMIGALDGELLTWHWTDLAFIALRRMFGLKTELFILLIAEIIGKCFYLQCARNLEDEKMSSAFSVIVCDEIAHLEFHTEFLRTKMERLTEPVRYLILVCWMILFYVSCFVFVADHGSALNEMDVSIRDFLRDCSSCFRRAAVVALDV
jgi:hypothetical protein